MNVKEQYWKYSLVTIIIVLGMILFVEFIPFLGGILGACTIYILVRKQMLYLTEKKHLRRSFVAIILLLETILCFLIPLSLAVWLLINKLQNFNLDPTQLVKSAEHIANLIEQRTGYDVLDTSNIMSAVSILPKIGQVLMGGISGFAINVAVLVLILYFMLIGGAKMEKYVYSILPFSDENKKNVLNEIKYGRHLQCDWNSVAGHHPRADRFARILDIRCAESLPFRLSDLFCYDHSGCGDCVGLVAFGSLYGVDRGLGECCRIDGLCFDYHYECG